LNLKIPLGKCPVGVDQNRCSPDDQDCYMREKPRKKKNVADFKLSETEITVGQFRHFVTKTGYVTKAEKYEEKGGGCWQPNKLDFQGHWQAPGFPQTEKHPVVCISPFDAFKYIKWLNNETGRNFRFPTETEWEYAARANSTTKYSWGDKVVNNMANCINCGSRWDNQGTSPVSSFAKNGFGLFDMHGNAEERTTCIPAALGTNSTFIWCGLRGGGWTGSDKDMRSSMIMKSKLEYELKGDVGIGLRLAED
jgi:formylglycine-generating enzyme required for sulfatase activity